MASEGLVIHRSEGLYESAEDNGKENGICIHSWGFSFGCIKEFCVKGVMRNNNFYNAYSLA